ncbi:MAG: metallophosphoesterase [Alphaproteobacteria bacterium]|nr:metallophosphoesterase [Alphaproteobacteria bacterium]
MTTFLTADLHLGHANIIGLCKRPFAALREMGRQLIDRWNGVVQPDDVVWALGDFAFRNERAAESYLNVLHGTKHLVIGNHDSEGTMTAPGWASIQPYAEIAETSPKIVMCHYPMRVWSGSHRDSWMLFGHVHGRLKPTRNTLDVGVGADANDFTPITLSQVVERMKRLENLPCEGRLANKVMSD